MNIARTMIRGGQLIKAAMIVCSLSSILSIAASPQSRDKSKKKFGSSLKRLKWDSARGAAVEKTDRSRTKPGDSGALELRTLLVLFDVLVTDASSRPVGGLRKEDFVVIEEDR